MHHQPDRAIADIAARQRGLITTAQLAEVGVGARAINRRVAKARLTRVLHGVYVVAVPALDHEAFLTAAELSSAHDAAFVDAAAASLHALLPTRPGVTSIAAPGVKQSRTRRTLIDVAGGGRGLIFVRQAELPAGEVDDVRGRRASSVARTLLDLARFDNDRFDRAWREALYRDVLKPAEIEAVLRAGRRSGAQRLRRKLRDEFFVELGPHGIDSPDELDFVQLVCRAGAPPPLVNYWIKVGNGWRRLDLYWPAARLAVELGRWRAHRSRESFEDDPVRAMELLDAHDILTLPITNTRMLAEPQWCADLVLRQIAARTRRD